MGDVIEFHRRKSISLTVQGIDREKFYNTLAHTILDRINWENHIKQLQPVHYTPTLTVYDSEYYNGRVEIPKKDIVPSS